MKMTPATTRQKQAHWTILRNGKRISKNARSTREKPKTRMKKSGTDQKDRQRVALLQNNHGVSLDLQALVQHLIMEANPDATPTQSVFFGTNDFSVEANKNNLGEPAVSSEDRIFCLAIKGPGVKVWPYLMRHLNILGTLHVARTGLREIVLSGEYGGLTLTDNDRLKNCTLASLRVFKNTWIEYNRQLKLVKGTFQGLGSGNSSVNFRYNNLSLVPSGVRTVQEGTLVRLGGNKIDTTNERVNTTLRTLQHRRIDVSFLPQGDPDDDKYR